MPGVLSTLANAASGLVSSLTQRDWPDITGVHIGVACVAVGQVVVISYHYIHRTYCKPIPIQKEENKYEFMEGVLTHAKQPEGMALLLAYLYGTWAFKLMPESYYSFAGGVSLTHLAAQLLITDALQAFLHYVEHKASPKFYQISHKPHHRFLNPRLFDAFNGSFFDTVCMILVPLYTTANLVHCNVWSYMAFGATYAGWLVLIHSEYAHPWDPLFRRIGFGTAGDHHVHHKLFIFNYGHLFMYWDRLFGTYRNPTTVKQFNEGI
eukprot:m.114548 g.114548  ORF g.114548 m.114548 type:complete len:265 (-) comp16028_c0_seq2:2026-2820(-)